MREAGRKKDVEMGSWGRESNERIEEWGPLARGGGAVSAQKGVRGSEDNGD